VFGQYVSRDSSVSIVTALQDGRPGFYSRQGQGIFIFALPSILALGPASYPTDTGDSFPSGRSMTSAPPSAEIENAWSYTSTPQCVFMTCCLVKRRDNFTFFTASQYVNTSISGLMLPPSSLHFTMKMEAARTSETLVSYHSTI
jgi:hypothetical protein